MFTRTDLSPDVASHRGRRATSRVVATTTAASQVPCVAVCLLRQRLRRHPAPRQRVSERHQSSARALTNPNPHSFRGNEAQGKAFGSLRTCIPFPPPAPVALPAVSLPNPTQPSPPSHLAHTHPPPAAFLRLDSAPLRRGRHWPNSTDPSRSAWQVGKREREERGWAQGGERPRRPAPAGLLQQRLRLLRLRRR